MFSKYTSQIQGILIAALLITGFFVAYPHYLDWALNHNQDREIERKLALAQEEFQERLKMNQASKPDSTYWRADTLVEVFKTSDTVHVHPPIGIGDTVHVLPPKVIRDTVEEKEVCDNAKGKIDYTRSIVR